MERRQRADQPAEHQPTMNLLDLSGKTVLITGGAGGIYYQADATQPEAVAALFDRVTAAQGLPDVVCCHAGMVEAYPVETYSLERFDRLMQLNLRSALVVAQAAAQRWIAAGRSGRLIFTTSWVQDVPWPEITPYTASKAGMK